jgi:hypothetical protein
VPAGFIAGFNGKDTPDYPLGATFTGRAWSEPTLLRLSPTPLSRRPRRAVRRLAMPLDAAHATTGLALRHGRRSRSSTTSLGNSSNFNLSNSPEARGGRSIFVTPSALAPIQEIQAIPAPGCLAWANVCIRVTTKRPGVTAMGANWPRVDGPTAAPRSTPAKGGHRPPNEFQPLSIRSQIFCNSHVAATGCTARGASEAVGDDDPLQSESRFAHTRQPDTTVRC